jgi:hypothetical protein
MGRSARPTPYVTLSEVHLVRQCARSSSAVLLLAGAGWALGALGGCGLSLDFDPADQPPGGMDAALIDGGTTTPDAARTDAGPPPPCEGDPDCDDGDACNGREACVAGECAPGEPIACPDDDVCDGTARCVDGECAIEPAPTCGDDGDACNGTEVCHPVLGCTRVEPIACDDGIECTDDVCDPSTGACSHPPDASRCTDAPGGRCEPETGCQYPSCNATTCVSNDCVLATCVDGETCERTPRCAAGTMCCAGSCVPAGCSDGEACTADACDPVRGCVHTALAIPCDDGDRCTVGERCRSDGTCGAGTPLDCSDGDPCTADVCRPASGCERPAAPDDTPCNDGDACTIADRCRAGVCTAGGAIFCAITDAQCVVAGCDAATGCVLSPIPEGRLCLGGTCDAVGNCCGVNTDCDGDGICECPTTCGFAGGCPGGACGDDGDCDPLQRCCGGAAAGTEGYCYDARCAGCCRS